MEMTQAKPSESKTVLQKKWGSTIIAAGYTAVPDMLLKRMGALGLKPMEMIVLLQILTYWWTDEARPFPSKKLLATAIGCKEKAVQRAISKLHNLGFLERIARPRVGDRNQTNIYDFKKLIAMLEPHATEEVAKIAEARIAKQSKLDRMRPRAKFSLVKRVR